MRNAAMLYPILTPSEFLHVRPQLVGWTNSLGSLVRGTELGEQSSCVRHTLEHAEQFSHGDHIERQHQQHHHHHHHHHQKLLEGF